MKPLFIPTILIIIMLAGGCTYQAQAPIHPADSVYSAYEDTIPGRFALYVDATAASGDFRVSGWHCSAHSYPLNAQQAIKTSALQTFQRLVSNIESVEARLDQAELVRRGFDGQIYIEIDDMDVELQVIPGFWSADMEADVEIAARLAVVGPNGPVLNTTVDADEDGKSDAGLACEGGATALSMATSNAIEELMERLGERFVNSPQVRQLAGFDSP